MKSKSCLLIKGITPFKECNTVKVVINSSDDSLFITASPTVEVRGVELWQQK